MRTRSRAAMAAIVSLALAFEATAQDPPTPPSGIEEIVVTAQKKEQFLREVPISMSVLDEGFIADQRVADFRDVSFYAPNVTIDNARNAPDIRIRGFGSPIANQSLEQSVGLVIDGIAYGRLPYWIGPIFDVKRVEVLRGPQGTLFGKNTTAGLVNVVTNKPTDEFTGHLDLELGELERRKFDVAVGGPILPGIVNVRLSGLSDERDGYMENTTAAVVPGAPDRWLSRDRKALRGQLGFPNVFGADVNLTAEFVDYSTPGNDGGEFFIVQDSVLAYSREYDPATDADPENRVGSLDERTVFDADILTFASQARYDLGDWGLNAILGHSRLENRRRVNLDPTPAQVLSASGGDEGFLSSAELRLDSPRFAGLLGLGSFLGAAESTTSDFTTGVFFQNQKIDDSFVTIPINLPNATRLIAAANTGVVLPCPVCARDVGVDSATVVYNQTTDSVAGFAQLNSDLIDRLALEAGLRLTREWKEADWVVSGSGVAGGDAALALLAGNRFVESESRSELAFTPKVALRYEWSDGLDLYASWGKGFKSGGFNDTTFSNQNRELLDFDAERMTAWETGMKGVFLDGTLSANLALFRMTATDLQIFTTEPGIAAGIGSLATRNAGEARSQGVEADVAYVPREWLTVTAALGFDDAEYLEFPLGPCTADRPNTDGDAEPRCDLSGEPLRATPKWKATVTTSVAWPLDSSFGADTLLLRGIDLLGGLTVEYDDVHFTTETVGDPRGRQDSFFLLGGSLGLGNTEQGWSLRVTGQNLLDEYVTKFSQEGAFTPGTWRRTPNEPRLVTASLRWQF